MTNKLKEIEIRAKKGSVAIGEMASNFRGPKMSIPVNEDRDEDVIIMQVCHKDVPLLIRAVRQLRGYFNAGSSDKVRQLDPDVQALLEEQDNDRKD
jgi:hypothetical protein